MKIATIKSIEKIAPARNIPMAVLFEAPGGECGKAGYLFKCYEPVVSKSKAEQVHHYRMLPEMEHYKSEK